MGHLSFLALRVAEILTLVPNGIFGIELPGPRDLYHFLENDLFNKSLIAYHSCLLALHLLDKTNILNDLTSDLGMVFLLMSSVLICNGRKGPSCKEF